ncbi:hypothetical protein BaRGS_00031036 [Batillaria attramentaria]|uniref:Uncharacterized protein n=1 Tax=Batillaria attramentaria TaxID=370345 RepID=A0ABD0JT48_9CAEN
MTKSARNRVGHKKVQYTRTLATRRSPVSSSRIKHRNTTEHAQVQERTVSLLRCGSDYTRTHAQSEKISYAQRCFILRRRTPRITDRDRVSERENSCLPLFAPLSSALTRATAGLTLGNTYL